MEGDDRLQRQPAILAAGGWLRARLDAVQQLAVARLLGDAIDVGRRLREVAPLRYLPGVAVAARVGLARAVGDPAGDLLQVEPAARAAEHVGVGQEDVVEA